VSLRLKLKSENQHNANHGAPAGALNLCPIFDSDSGGASTRRLLDFLRQFLDCFYGNALNLNHFAAKPATDSNSEHSYHRQRKRHFALRRQAESEPEADRKNRNSTKVGRRGSPLHRIEGTLPLPTMSLILVAPHAAKV
jgi:hypothetical protein